MDYLRRPPANKPSMSRPEPAARRLSTPAGQRLSVIMESGQFAGKGAQPASLDGSTLRPNTARLRQSGFDQWSDDSTPESSEHAEKFQQLRHNRHLAARGGWKRLALITTVILLVIVGIVVGVVVGVQNRNRNQDDSPDAASSQQPLPSSAADTSPSRPNDPSSPQTSSTPSTLSDDPTGLYTALIFLNNVLTDCTSRPETWSCYPGTTYQVSRTRSATPFIYNITRNPRNNDEFLIQSGENPQQISLEPTKLVKTNSGGDDEHWRFQTFIDKTVQTAQSLTDDGNLSLCNFNRTTYTGYLYTRAERELDIEQVQDQYGDNLWPFKAKVDQSIAGGEDTPMCYRLTNGVAGDQITEGLTPVNASMQCTCLWRS